MKFTLTFLIIFITYCFGVAKAQRNPNPLITCPNGPEIRPDPMNSNKYIRCIKVGNNVFAYVFSCPMSLPVFDAASLKCISSDSVSTTIDPALSTTTLPTDSTTSASTDLTTTDLTTFLTSTTDSTVSTTTELTTTTTTIMF